MGSNRIQASVRSAVGRFRWVSALAALATLGATQAAHATYYVINSTAMNTTDDGVCTFLEALQAANDLAGVSCSGGCDCAAGTNDDTIILPTGTLTSTVKLQVRNRLSIYGAGVASTTIAANYDAISYLTLFDVVGQADASLHLYNLTVRNNTTVASRLLAGVFGHEGGALDLNGVRITGFTAGGVRVRDTDLTLHRTRVDHNSTPEFGAGIRVESFDLPHSSLFIYDSEISQNSAVGAGGGVYYSGGTGAVEMSTFANNSASTGGGAYIATQGEGGGYCRFIHATLAFNSASTRGGGLLLDTSSQLQLTASILAGNTAPAGAGPNLAKGAFATTLSNAADTVFGVLDATVPAFTDDTHNLKNVADAKLGSLRSMGGIYSHLQVVPLLKSSPAIDYVQNQPSIVDNNDQRGLLAVVDGDDVSPTLPDAGAFEKNLRWESELGGYANASSGDVVETDPNTNYSNFTGQLLRANQNSDQITFPIYVAESGTYNLKIRIKKAPDAGFVQAKYSTSANSNFTNFGSEQNGYASSIGFLEFNLGNKSLSPGPHYIRMQVTGAGSGGGRYVYTDYIKVVKQ